jgi:hypothetical protein
VTSISVQLSGNLQNGLAWPGNDSRRSEHES